MWIECTKIWYNKRIMGCVLLLFLMEMGSFLYTARQKQIQWETWNGTSYQGAYIQTEQEYLSNFHGETEAVLQQADSMGAISIFAQADSFSAKNLERTKADFEWLLEIEPMFIESPFLDEFFSDGGVHIFVMTAGLLFAFALVDEQKQGLRGMIYSTVNGRGTYVICKIAALLVWTGIVTFLYYGGLLFASSICFEGNIMECLTFPMQSLSVLGNVPWRLSIGDFLLLYMLGRWLAVFFLTFIVWTILFCIDQMLIGAGAIGGMGLLTFGIYMLIDGSHAWNLLRYCNPWYWICGNAFFTEYRNLDVFSQAVNKNTVIVVWMFLGMLLLAAVSFSVGAKRYPCETSKSKVIQYGRRVIQKSRQWQSSWMAGLGLTGMEYYKILISQKGILLLLAIVGVFVYQADFSKVQFATSQKMYFSFVERNTGVPDEASEKELQETETMLEEVEQKYLLDKVRYDAGEITSDEWMGTSMWYASYEQERFFFDQMAEQTLYLETLKEERGIDGWYVNLYGYNRLLSEGSAFMNVLLCFGVVLLCGGMFSIERKSGMIPVIRSSAMGEKSLFVKKRKAAWALSLLLYLILSGLEFGTVAYVYGLGGWGAPVQSIVKLSGFPVPCSIGVFFIMLFLIRGMGIIVLAGAGCFISSKRRRH